MSDHQETLAQVVKRIDTSFDKIKQYNEKADQYRISAGKQLVELQTRIEKGEVGPGVKWWSWYAQNFKNRTRRDASRVMALARADDPEAAAEEERTKAREGMQRTRAANNGAMTNVSHAPQPGTDANDQSHWTEADYAAQIVRGVVEDVRELEGEVADLDLVRELIFRDLPFALGLERPEPSAIEPPKKPRGRPPGSKNKLKEPPQPAPVTNSPVTTGNDVPTDDSAEAMKKKFEEAEASSASPEPATAAEFTDDDLRNPNHPLHRPAPEQTVQP